MRGWYGLPCWNGLSKGQQDRLLEIGNLPLGYKPDGMCPNGAEVEIQTIYDRAPGPRFYCAGCGAEFLQHLAVIHNQPPTQPLSEQQ